MIQPEELRLGNKVLRKGLMYDDDKYYITIVDHNDIAACVINSENFKPIPITEDILLEYSFIEDYRSEWTVKYSHERYTMVGYEWNKNFGWRFRYYGAMLSYIEQLHQLQNIFYALMKVELQIKNI